MVKRLWESRLTMYLLQHCKSSKIYFKRGNRNFTKIVMPIPLNHWASKCKTIQTIWASLKSRFLFWTTTRTTKCLSYKLVGSTTKTNKSIFPIFRHSRHLILDKFKENQSKTFLQIWGFKSIVGTVITKIQQCKSKAFLKQIWATLHQKVYPICKSVILSSSKPISISLRANNPFWCNNYQKRKKNSLKCKT